MSDAAIIELGRQFEIQSEDVESRIRDIDAVFDVAETPDLPQQDVAAFEAIYGATAATCATTIDGLIVKARIAAAYPGDPLAAFRDQAMDERVVNSIVADLLVMAGLSEAREILSAEIQGTALAGDK